MLYDLTLASPGPTCYHADPFSTDPVRMGDFVGSIEDGGPVNHKEVRFTPHGTGTHTECYGHIVDDREATIDQCLRRFQFFGLLLTVEPEKVGENLMVTLSSMESRLPEPGVCQALILRTLPNGDFKKTANYSGTNPPYLEAAIAQRLVELNIQHIVVDLPSVDKEVDGGALTFHRTFWQTNGPAPIRRGATITELAYIPDTAPDGPCKAFIAPARWVLDAAPSRVWIETN